MPSSASAPWVGALATGMLAAGWVPDQLSLAIRRPDQVEELRTQTGVSVGLDARVAAAGREVIVVAVKPRDVSDAARLPGLGDHGRNRWSSR